jgi:hypothetical protein
VHHGFACNVAQDLAGEPFGIEPSGDHAKNF